MYLKHWIAIVFLVVPGYQREWCWLEHIQGQGSSHCECRLPVVLCTFLLYCMMMQIVFIIFILQFFSVWLLLGSFKKKFYMHCWGSWWSQWGTHSWLLVTAIHDAVWWPDTLHLTFKKLRLHSLFLSCLFQFGGTDRTFFGYLTCFCGVLTCTWNESFYTDIGFQ